MNTLNKDIAGITIIEIIVVIAITGILITAIYSLLFSGFKSFNMGAKQQNVQQNFRLIEEVLKNKLRNALCIAIDDNDNCSGSNKLIFNKGENGLYHLKQDTRKISDDIISSITIFKKDNTIKFEINFSKQEETFTMKILLNNYEFTTEEKVKPGTDNNITIYYKSPA